MSLRCFVCLIGTFAFLGTGFAEPPVRQFDAPGSPPFKVLKSGENPPLDAYDNFVIGPDYVPAPENNEVAGVPQGKVQQFTIDSKETRLFNPGIARNEFGTVDPNNPKTLIVDTHEIDYVRPAFLGEEIVVRTWVATMSKAGSQRRYHILRRADGQQLAKALTDWAFVDYGKGLPKRIPPEVAGAFEVLGDAP